MEWILIDFLSQTFKKVYIILCNLIIHAAKLGQLHAQDANMREHVINSLLLTDVGQESIEEVYDAIDNLFLLGLGEHIEQHVKHFDFADVTKWDDDYSKTSELFVRSPHTIILPMSLSLAK